MSKKIRNILIILFVFIVMIICLLAKFYKDKINEEKKNDDSENIIFEMIEETNIAYLEGEENFNGWKQVTAPNDYYTIKNIIDKYYENLEKFSDDYVVFSRVEMTAEELEENLKLEREFAQDVINGLLNKYIETIDSEQLKQIINENAGKQYSIKKMYYKAQSNTIKSYYIIGEVDDKEYSLIILINKENKVCTILPNEYIEKKYGKDVQVGEIEFSTEELNIEANIYNKVSDVSISEQTMCMYYFGDYLNKLKGSAEELYDVLDEEYRDARFGSYENFKSFIKNNYNDLAARKLSEYSVEADTDEMQTIYICRDQYENYYIFKTSAVMEYTLYLDNHTIDLPQFTEKYNSSSTENKVAMNIEKVKDAINTKDYEYIYEKLDSTFKNNNYPSLEALTSYIQNNLYEKNIFAYRNIEEQNDIYIFKVEVSDMEDKNLEIKTINIVMKLNEGTDFTMSFNMNE